MITIMTPTYNRAYILGEAYESLKKQSSFEFEWIIIDDGSTDDTESIVKKWIEEEHAFSIVYQKQENGGKHRAINKAVLLAKYDYFFILDSDDKLTDDAVCKIHKWIRETADLEGFAGISGLRKIGEADFGGIPKAQYIDTTNLERKKYGLLGDKAEIYKTAVLKQYPFPEFKGENFIRESAVWDRIAKDGLKIRFYNEVIYLCEYIEDGLTKNTDKYTYAKNFEGFTYCTKLFLETHSFISRLNQYGHFSSVAKIKGLNCKEAAKLLNAKLIYFSVGICYYKARQLIKAIIQKKGKAERK